MKPARSTFSGSTIWNMCQFEFSKSSGGSPQPSERSQAERRGGVGHVELSAAHLDLSAVLAGADPALQPPLLAACGERRIGQHQRAALGGGEVLVGVDAEGQETAEAADGAAPPARTERLRRVL